MKASMRVAFGAGVLLAVLPGLALAKKNEKEGETVVGVSVEASALLGLGVSAGIGLADRFNVRAAYHGFTYDIDEVENEGATYEGELELKSTGLFADWHPFAGAFRITGGFASNGNQINLTGVPTNGEFDVGDCTFQSDPSDPLTVDGHVDFASTAPYLGIGWGGNLNAEPGFYATFDIGVLFSGSPDTSLNGRGRASNADPIGRSQCGNGTSQDVSNYPEFEQAVQDAEDDVNEETKNYELWPNIAFGLGWRF